MTAAQTSSDMDLTQQPKPDHKDYAYGLIKGTISSFPMPFVAGIAAELFSLLLASPLSKRQEEWTSSLAQELVRLRDKVDGFNLEDLSSNDSFITMTLQATQCALRNHQQEKLEALRNAVLNSALPNAPEDDLQLIFLNLVDTLTPWHLRILKLFDHPTGWMEINGKPFPRGQTIGGVSNIIDHAYPELKRYGELTGQIIKDLSSHGLAEIPSGTMSVSGMLASRSTDLGRKFLQFISIPKPLE